MINMLLKLLSLLMEVHRLVKSDRFADHFNKEKSTNNYGLSQAACCFGLVTKSNCLLLLEGRGRLWLL